MCWGSFPPKLHLPWLDGFLLGHCHPAFLAGLVCEPDTPPWLARGPENHGHQQSGCWVGRGSCLGDVDSGPPTPSVSYSGICFRGLP